MITHMNFFTTLVTMLRSVRLYQTRARFKRSRTRPTEEREKRRLIESPTIQFRHRPIGLTEKEDSEEMDSEESCDFAAECTSKKAKKFQSLSQWNKNTGI